MQWAVALHELQGLGFRGSVVERLVVELILAEPASGPLLEGPGPSLRLKV